MADKSHLPDHDAQSTAVEVMSTVDLAGRLALVTGGYSGLGLVATRELARADARVVVPARRAEAAKRALDGLDGIEVDEVDLADLASVRAFSQRFLDRHDRLDLLIANAGIMACPETRVGPGWEAQFATNHLGHYALTCLLWPALRSAAGARVVSVASGWDPAWSIRWHDVQFEHGYDKWAAYTQSKLANILFARHLDRLGARAEVHAFSVNPGYILTPLQRHLGTDEMVAAGWIDSNGVATPGLFKTPEEGAATTLWAATSPMLTAHGGAYCADCRVVDAQVDEDEARRLWSLSESMTGIGLPE
ncbi:NAD(P)-dependent dehydrogenase (short-subunit alcohol dehydrogenase family) [Kribbella pratensis]|uniref:NAD(P)-dependent dehydrogenase (Short-subunit alcohol dehydrogenase family) n=1 Tax=Kribbella pratensis TaxID=2512112 RepID=A0ABY2F7C3_9ACTN|nr:SDR family NAD(P)-dependent oxidoreductase [Kribbella pratensis]TDW84287.1 NAD(P)-dependent dehydrogenase (short-subunit alcohol dehydrogenase family) [Kribbella pratensis]